MGPLNPRRRECGGSTVFVDLCATVATLIRGASVVLPLKTSDAPHFTCVGAPVNAFTHLNHTEATAATSAMPLHRESKPSWAAWKRLPLATVVLHVLFWRNLGVSALCPINAPPVAAIRFHCRFCRRSFRRRARSAFVRIHPPTTSPILRRCISGLLTSRQVDPAALRPSRMQRDRLDAFGVPPLCWSTRSVSHASVGYAHGRRDDDVARLPPASSTCYGRTSLSREHQSVL